MLRNFICPDGGLQPVDKCLAGECRMAERCAPLSFLTLAGHEREWTGKPSTTQLLKGTRQAYLELTTDYDKEPEENVFAILGTGVHKLLEDSEETQAYVEEKVELEGITGIMDRLERQPDGTWYLVDYKVSGSYKIAQVLGIYSEYKDVLDSTGRYPVRYKSGAKKGQVKKKKVMVHRDPDYGDWLYQLNFYRIAEEKYIGYPISKIKLFATVRDGGTFIAEGRGLSKRAYYIDIPIVEDDVILTYFRSKRNALLSALETDTTPSLCDAKESWDGRKCERFCPVAEACRALGDNKWLPAA